MEDDGYIYDFHPEIMTDVFEEDDINSSEERNTRNVLEHCVKPSITSVVPNILHLLMFNLVFIASTQTGLIPKIFNHAVSLILGLLLLMNLNCSIKYFIFIFYLFSSYFTVYASNKLCKMFDFSSTLVTTAVLIMSLLFCEFYFPYPNKWLEVRGIVMILVMKAISLAHDFENRRRLPPLVECLGYMCCPANCMFGPWISFNQYCTSFARAHKWNLWWIVYIIWTLALALIFLTVSNCWSDYFLDGDNQFLQSYKMALTFRTSHYFVSYLSEMGMIAAGFKNERCSPNSWRFRVVNPIKVEVPSSLVSVVTNWNIPMHLFLKKHVYRKVLLLGKFWAIFVTYFMSALLHGFNVEIAVVLLSIGVYSYVQFRLREKLSHDLNACVQIKACDQCTHKYKKYSFLVICLKIFFCLMTVLHLAYLGMLMDAVGNPDSPSILKKWESLNFCSHILIFFGYLYCLS